MKTVRRWIVKFFGSRPPQPNHDPSVDEARARVAHDKLRVARSAARLERGAAELHRQVHKENHISASIEALLRGKGAR